MRIVNCEYLNIICNFVIVPNILLYHFVNLLILAPSQSSGPLYYPQCHCGEDKAGYVCPKHDSHINPPSFKVVTSDVLQNITGQNIDLYLLFTSDEFVLHRSVRHYVNVEVCNNLYIQ